MAFGGYKYYQAIDLYKTAYSKEKSKAVKAEILFQIGECYRLKEDEKQASVWYNKAIKAKYEDPIAIYYLAEIYKKTGKYEDAIVEFKKYKAANPGDKRADDGIKSCELAKSWIDEPTRYVVNPMPLLNSEEFDFSPIYADKKNEVLYFTSTRQGSAGTVTSDVTGSNFADIYWTKRDKKGKWSEPSVLNETVNSEASEGSACLNKKKNVIYFTRCGVEKNAVMGCSIYWAKKAGINWGEPEMIPIAADTFAVGHPAISADDKVLVFASDMPGGQGGKDLWYVTLKDKRGNIWSEPTNLGSEINTPGDEMFPFIRENGELFFASNGHIGMGGLDIFKATSKGVNQWGGVENLKSPINSGANDFALVFDGKKDRGFFTSDREGGKGGDDIWEFYMPPLLFQLTGTVKDVDTDKPLANAAVKIIGTDGSTGEVTTDENGYFEFIENGPKRYLNPNTSYSIIVEKEKYLKAKGKETTVGLDNSKKFEHVYALQPMQGPIKLPLILYEYNKADLLPESKDSLNYLYNILVENPNIVIQLRSHTDYRGSDSYNKRLSQRRAQSCVDYLVEEKGIAADRIVAKGMGETEPLLIKGTNVVLDKKYIDALPSKEEQEAAHQKNRRTDFKVLRDDYVPKTEQGTESN